MSVLNLLLNCTGDLLERVKEVERLCNCCLTIESQQKRRVKVYQSLNLLGVEV